MQPRFLIIPAALAYALLLGCRAMAPETSTVAGTDGSSRATTGCKICVYRWLMVYATPNGSLPSNIAATFLEGDTPEQEIYQSIFKSLKPQFKPISKMRIDTKQGPTDSETGSAAFLYSAIVQRLDDNSAVVRGGFSGAGEYGGYAASFVLQKRDGEWSVVRRLDEVAG